jgi:hypothetical protein
VQGGDAMTEPDQLALDAPVSLQDDSDRASKVKVAEARRKRGAFVSGYADTASVI